MTPDDIVWSQSDTENQQLTSYEVLWPPSDFHVGTRTNNWSEGIYNFKTVTKSSLHVNNTRGKTSTYIFSFKTFNKDL